MRIAFKIPLLVYRFCCLGTGFSTPAVIDRIAAAYFLVKHAYAACRFELVVVSGGDPF